MKAAAIRKRYFIAVLFALSFLIYGRAVQYDFLWDDQRSHLSNHAALMNDDLAGIWSKPYDGLYIPVSYTAWDILRHLPASHNGDQLLPAPFHLANILLHAFNSVLVFLLLFQLFKNQPAAFAGALIFLCHPLQVESVAWISEFRGLLAAFFSLLSLSLLLTEFSKAKQRLSFLILATIFYILALLSKPSAISLPLIAAVLCWGFYPGKLRQNLVLLFTWIALFIPVAVITSRIQPVLSLQDQVSAGERFFVFNYSLWFYITKLFMPFKLAACYGLTPKKITGDNWIYLYSFIVTGTGIFLWIRREKFRMLFVVFFLFAAVILPVSGLISFNYQRYSNVADRYMYFALLAASLLTAWIWSSTKKISPRILIFVFIGCSILLSSLQLPAWKNEFEMWDQSMRYYPEQFMAAYNRGVQYAKAGKLDLAITDYSTALQYNDKDAATYTNRANAYAQKNMLREALQDYKTALTFAPADGSIYYNRALTWYRQGDYFQSSNDLQKARMSGFVPDPEFVKAVEQGIRSMRR